MMNEKIKNVGIGVVILLLSWVFITNIISHFMSKMTQTELVLHFSKTILLNWSKCE
jgi:hypothetical protein